MCIPRTLALLVSSSSTPELAHAGFELDLEPTLQELVLLAGKTADVDNSGTFNIEMISAFGIVDNISSHVPTTLEIWVFLNRIFSPSQSTRSSEAKRLVVLTVDRQSSPTNATVQPIEDLSPDCSPLLSQR